MIILNCNLLGEALLAGGDEVAVAELEARVALLDGGDGDRAEPGRHHAQDEAEESPQLERRHDETGMEGESEWVLSGT